MQVSSARRVGAGQVTWQVQRGRGRTPGQPAIWILLGVTVVSALPTLTLLEQLVTDFGDFPFRKGFKQGFL